MKSKKILKALGLIKNNDQFITSKIIKASALTIACVFSLPSFAQTTSCEWGTSDDNGEPTYICTQNPGYEGPIWGAIGTLQFADEPSYCDMFSGEDCRSDEEQDDDYGYCTSLTEATLRQMKQDTPGCYSDPGNEFNINQWYARETGWLYDVIGYSPFSGTNNGYGWFDVFQPPIEWLANELIYNNGNLSVLYEEFAHDLHQSCYWDDDILGDIETLRECNVSVYILLDSYYPGFAVINSVLNFFGASLPVNDYQETWGGRLVRDVQNFAQCRNIYNSWEEENCGGPL